MGGVPPERYANIDSRSAASPIAPPISPLSASAQTGSIACRHAAFAVLRSRTLTAFRPSRRELSPDALARPLLRSASCQSCALAITVLLMHTNHSTRDALETGAL